MPELTDNEINIAFPNAQSKMIHDKDAPYQAEDWEPGMTFKGYHSYDGQGCGTGSQASACESWKEFAVNYLAESLNKKKITINQVEKILKNGHHVVKWTLPGEVEGYRGNDAYIDATKDIYARLRDHAQYKTWEKMAAGMDKITSISKKGAPMMSFAERERIRQENKALQQENAKLKAENAELKATLTSIHTDFESKLKKAEDEAEMNRVAKEALMAMERTCTRGDEKCIKLLTDAKEKVADDHQQALQEHRDYVRRKTSKRLEQRLAKRKGSSEAKAEAAAKSASTPKSDSTQPVSTEPVDGGRRRRKKRKTKRKKRKSKKRTKRKSKKRKTKRRRRKRRKSKRR